MTQHNAGPGAGLTSKTLVQDVMEERLAFNAFKLKIYTIGDLVVALNRTPCPLSPEDAGLAVARLAELGFDPELEKERDPRIVPLERVELDSPLDGRTGDNRDVAHQSLEAYDDVSAIRHWLEARARNANTRQVYRKEAERFLLWCTAEKAIAMSAIGISEAKDYLSWLEALGRASAKSWCWNIPQAAWIGPKNVARSDASWKPFNGPLSHTSRKMALTVVRQLFGFLAKTGYIVHNPFDQISPKVPYLAGEGAAKRFADRSFSEAQWDEVHAQFEAMPDGPEKARMAVILAFGKGLGMRASEMLAARASWVVRARLDGAEQTAIEIIGKGDKARRLPLSDEQVAILNAYLASRGIPPLGVAPGRTPLLASLGKGRETAIKAGQASRSGLSRSGLYRVLKVFLEGCALRLEVDSPMDAARFRAASTHWLRHTFATSALKEMPVNIVQTALGHASVATTSRYLTPEESELARAMRKMRAF